MNVSNSKKKNKHNWVRIFKQMDKHTTKQLSELKKIHHISPQLNLNLKLKW